MICPLMSKIVDYPFKDEYDRDKVDFQLFEVECKKKDCALWKRNDDKEFCGLQQK